MGSNTVRSAAIIYQTKSKVKTISSKTTVIN